MKYVAIAIAAVLVIGLAGCAQPEPWRVIGAEMTADGNALFTAKGESPVVDADDAVQRHLG